MYELAREQRQQKNYAAAQLTLSMAAIHTTTEGLTQALLDLCIRPEFVRPLREEVIKVVGEEGWTKQAIYKLRLMDSFLKESQRFHPPNFLSMNRLALVPITLSDGTTIPKGAQVMVANRFEDPAVYADPSKFDPYRYLREREKPGQTNTWQHVSLSSQHMAFGFGDHACPGRFFASNEMKIALRHLLLKYDWELPEGEEPFWSHETNTLTRATCKVRLRRRKEEINLDLQNHES
jgi:cytochrome P450